MRSFSEKLGYPQINLTEKVISIFKEYPWKGNIRELRNVIERSLIVSDNNCIEPKDLPLEMHNMHMENSDGKRLSEFDMGAMECRHIARVLQYTQGNKSEAARLLKIGLTTLYRKIEEYKL